MIDALAADRARIVNLNAQIQDLECSLRSLSALQSERALVQERLDSYKYPVLTLPEEIVCEIFIHFLPVYPSSPPLTGPHSPILLTHICGEWRRIALAFPALWRAIEISSDNPSWLLPSVVLGRSGFCPLSIRVDDLYRELGNLGSVLAAILLHRARWEYLSLRLIRDRSDYPDIGGPMPLLRHLDLEFESDTDVHVPSFAEAPLLRTAILNDSASRGIILPWAQLTSLTLKIMYLYECVPFLQQAANLTHCELEILHDFNETSVADIVLPSLQSLTLNDPHPVVHRVDHLQSFFVPALCSLEISECFLGRDPIDSLASFIAKSGCKLQRVDIVDRYAVSRHSYRTKFPAIRVFSMEEKIRIRTQIRDGQRSDSLDDEVS
ncbi:hypothetical protein DFH08DRAFT_846502 [Mycena albidolilacea]|uniref:F-box domain-containing protein n=1 Tax=Mycena albidolilacea TaxID=1033008 RepID=A0AAD7AIA1_9AGAR|nr:hypothetical protein DFH08DRAFT_846502 [Mycena albidolilacea]